MRLELRGHHCRWTRKAEQQVVLGVDDESKPSQSRCFQQIASKNDKRVETRGYLLDKLDVFDELGSREILDAGILMKWTWTSEKTLAIISDLPRLTSQLKTNDL